MEKPDNKIQYTSKTFFFLAFFMFYLAFMDGSISGNSILLVLVGILFLILAMMMSDKVRQWFLHRAGITEVDLTKIDKKKE